MIDDQTLIRRFLAGEQRAFDQLVLKYQEQVRRFMFRATQDTEDANDLAQETFIKVYGNLHRFRGDSQLATWLYRIAANVLSSHFRRRRLRDWAPLTVEPAAANPDSGEIMERHRRILALLPRLSRQERQVVILRGLQELSVADTARILGATENVVKVAYHTARKKLKGFFDDEN